MPGHHLELGFSLLSLHAQDIAPNETVMQDCVTREQWKNEKDSKEARRPSVEGTFLPAQDEKDENDLTEINKMMITSKDLSLSNHKERFSLPSFHRQLFLLFTGFQEGDK